MSEDARAAGRMGCTKRECGRTAGRVVDDGTGTVVIVKGFDSSLRRAGWIDFPPVVVLQEGLKCSEGTSAK